MAENTHNGNLNRSKVPATGVEGTKSVGKSNGEEATLRRGNLPKASTVTTVDRSANKGKAVECARKQNLSDQKSGVGNQAQVEAGKERPTTTSSGNCGCK